LGQSSSYWSGDYATVQELNPAGNFLLRWSPIAFALGVVAWLVVIVIGIACLPPALGLAVSWMIAFAHSIGVASWFVRHGPVGWVGAAIFFLMAESFLDFAWRRTASERRKAL
jgi:hypothetical protein